MDFSVAYAMNRVRRPPSLAFGGEVMLINAFPGYQLPSTQWAIAQERFGVTERLSAT
jgi:hypothetical protein